VNKRTRVELLVDVTVRPLAGDPFVVAAGTTVRVYETQHMNQHRLSVVTLDSERAFWVNRADVKPITRG
jgi:hypothetical protein